MSVSIGGKPLKLVYDWAALSALRTSFTDAQIEGVVSGKLFEPLADMVAIGLARHQPDITAEWVREQSPPLLLIIKAVNEALNFAYFGAGTAASSVGKQQKPAQKTNR